MAVPLMAKLDAAMLEKAHHLKVILQYGVGVEGVDIPAVSLFAPTSRPSSWLRFTRAKLASLKLLDHTREAHAMHCTQGHQKAMHNRQWTPTLSNGVCGPLFDLPNGPRLQACSFLAAQA